MAKFLMNMLTHKLGMWNRATIIPAEDLQKNKSIWTSVTQPASALHKYGGCFGILDHELGRTEITNMPVAAIRF